MTATTIAYGKETADPEVVTCTPGAFINQVNVYANPLVTGIAFFCSNNENSTLIGKEASDVLYLHEMKKGVRTVVLTIKSESGVVAFGYGTSMLGDVGGDPKVVTSENGMPFYGIKFWYGDGHIEGLEFLV